MSPKMMAFVHIVYMRPKFIGCLRRDETKIYDHSKLSYVYCTLLVSGDQSFLGTVLVFHAIQILIWHSGIKQVTAPEKCAMDV
jgi:hypothetical protein